MARRRFNDLQVEDEIHEKFGNDAADQAFWDEFWTQENSKNEEAPLVTIVIRNQETGEERVIENVRLRFRNVRKLRG